MRFSQEPAASALLRGLKIHARYVFNRAPHSLQRALKAKTSERRGGGFSGSARRQDAEIPGVFYKERQRGKARQFIPLRRIVL